MSNLFYLLWFPPIFIFLSILTMIVYIAMWELPFKVYNYFIEGGRDE